MPTALGGSLCQESADENPRGFVTRKDGKSPLLNSFEVALTFRTEFFRNLLGKKDALLSNCQFESELGQCIMKERPLQEVEAGCGAASAPLRCAGLRSSTAARE